MLLSLINVIIDKFTVLFNRYQYRIIYALLKVDHNISIFMINLKSFEIKHRLHYNID